MLGWIQWPRQGLKKNMKKKTKLKDKIKNARNREIEKFAVLEVPSLSNKLVSCASKIA